MCKHIISYRLRSDLPSQAPAMVMLDTDADLERQLVLDIRKGGMGWQGAAWLLERLEPGTYTAEAAAEQGLGEQFSVEELVTIIREAGLVV